MKKVLTVFLWLGLGACLIMMFSLNREKSGLKLDVESAQRKNDILQTLYDQAKREWEETGAELKGKNAALTAAADALREENDGLKQEVAALAEAGRQAEKTMALARQEWENQRLALTAEKEAASGRLSDVLAVLLTPAPEDAAPREEEPRDLFAQETPGPAPSFLDPLPAGIRNLLRLGE